MAKKKIYRAFGYEITIDEAIEAACVSRGAFYAQLSALGGSMETVLRMYDQRYGGVMARLEQIMQDKGAGEMSNQERFRAAGEDEAAKEQILNILFDADRTASVPVESVAAEPEAAPMEEPAEEPTAAMAMSLAVELEAVKPDRRGLKLLNGAIKALDRLEEYADGSDRIKPEEQSAIEGMSRRLTNMRIREYVELVDWEALEV